MAPVDLLRLRNLSARLQRFARQRDGSAAVFIGVAVLVLFMTVGVATDIGRSITLKTQLQRAADSAALAGAVAYTTTTNSTSATTAATNYMNGAIANLKDATNAQFNVALGQNSTSGTTTDYLVTVAASAEAKTIAARMLTSSIKVGVSATADNPVFTVKIALSTFSSSAYDGDAIYYYVVPSDGGVPASMKQIFSNFNSTCTTLLRLTGQSQYIDTSASSSTVTVTLTAGQKIGFALVNVTGCNMAYAANGYGSLLMTANTLYSHLSPPSAKAYPSQKNNCALQVITSGTPTSGSCYAATPTLGAFNCANAGTNTTYFFYWNDMGGGSDDYDYNDAVYKVGCQTTGSVYTGVVLTK